MVYKVQCKCDAIHIDLSGEPILHATCHCADCRDLLSIPFNMISAWQETQVEVVKGQSSLEVFKHPTLNMAKYYCRHCADVLYNTNGMNWRVVSLLLIKRSNQGYLPEELEPDKHFFYELRIADIKDELPKYLRGTSGPLYQES